jgi:hypothetical protein
MAIRHENRGTSMDVNRLSSMFDGFFPYIVQIHQEEA